MLDDIVRAAVDVARQRGQDVAEVPLPVIAAAAGLSRSTLIRRLGGRRETLDEAVRAAGVDPGGRVPVRERAITAAAELMAARGLSAVTLSAVATAVGCSLPTLHATFDRRDGLLHAVFDRYLPIDELEALAGDPPEALEETVEAVQRTLITALTRQPRVFPAMLADAFGRSDGPTGRSLLAWAPRLMRVFQTLLVPHVRAGRLRPLPLPLLIQLLISPLVTHLLLRPVLEPALAASMPEVEQVRAEFSAAFLRAAAME
ncbi:TetR/AcrR family transcriptional regulator [Nonomuraea composti]|nr:helix-turn-helix domain-containing protein [Nonomuraea sp. FMUSA5-5]